MTKLSIRFCIERANRAFNATRVGGLAGDMIIGGVMNRVEKVKHQGVTMRFAAPNSLCRYRADSFATKEPDTLEWIDGLPGACTLWDVGANVGLYSVYAAKKRGCKVVAFEPSVFNLELLARNLFLNGLQDQVGIVPIALSDGLGMNQMRMSNTEWGGALSGFGHNVDQNGVPIKAVFEYQTIGVSMNQAVSLLQLPQPGFLKIDVDGIEHFILRGGHAVLSQVQSVLIEINDEFTDQAEEAARHLKNVGLTLYRKCDLGVPNTFNQWWRR